MPTIELIATINVLEKKLKEAEAKLEKAIEWIEIEGHTQACKNARITLKKCCCMHEEKLQTLETTNEQKP